MITHWHFKISPPAFAGVEMTVVIQYLTNALLPVCIAQDLNIYVKFLAELGWLFPERRYLKRISPDIPAG